MTSTFLDDEHTEEQKGRSESLRQEPRKQESYSSIEASGQSCDFSLFEGKFGEVAEVLDRTDLIFVKYEEVSKSEESIELLDFPSSCVVLPRMWKEIFSRLFVAGFES